MKALPLEFRMAWATRLRRAMEAKAIKTEELAKRSGRSPSIIYRWLNGQFPELPDIKILAELLDEDPAYLIWGDERPKAKPRQGRGRVRSLLLALAAGALGLWPSPGVAAPAQPLAVVISADILHLIGSWRRRVFPDSWGMALA